MFAQVDITLLRHRKVRGLARELGIHRPEALGIMASIWVWALEQAPDGDLSDVNWPDLLEDIGCENLSSHGLRDAMIRVGWLDEKPLRLHDWDKHTGAGIIWRAADAARKRTARAVKRADEENIHGTSDGHPLDVQGQGVNSVGTVRLQDEDEDEDEDKHKHEEHISPSAPALTRAAVLLGAIDGRGKTTNAKDTELHRLILECWAKAVGRDAKRVTLTAKRKAALKKAFTDGSAEKHYQPSDVLKAAEGLALSPWHMGKERGATKKFDDLVYALRDVEKYRDLWESQKQVRQKQEIPSWALEEQEVRDDDDNDNDG